MTFADTVKAGRRKLDMTQKQFADFLHVPFPTLQGWERTESKDPNQATQNYVKVAIARPDVVREVLKTGSK